MCIDEDTFKKLNPPETRVDYDIHPSKNKNSGIELLYNGPKYIREINPYEKMVNMAMIDNKKNRKKFSFKANSFYQKAVEYSQKPKEAKMDSNNPIYAYIPNPNEYRYYHLQR